MGAGVHGHASGGGRLERRLLPVYLLFLLIAPFVVALLFLVRDPSYLRITLLLLLGNLYPAYRMVASMSPSSK